MSFQGWVCLKFVQIMFISVTNWLMKLPMDLSHEYSHWLQKNRALIKAHKLELFNSLSNSLVVLILTD